MTFYRLVSRCPANTPSGFIGYIIEHHTHEHNRRQMVRLQFTSQLAQGLFRDAWFYMDDLEVVN